MAIISCESDNKIFRPVDWQAMGGFLPVVTRRRRGGTRPLGPEERIARFWARVNRGQPDECWLWRAGVTRDGYGLVSMGRLADGRSVNDYAHRISYRLLVGPIPDGAVLRHTCDVPRCVNPRHLIPGTQADNLKDARDRGRLVSTNERPGAWVIAPELRRRLIAEALAGPRGTITRLAREHHITSWRSFAVAVARARRRQRLASSALRRTA